MQDRTIEKIRKYKRDHNMKQTEHGLVVMECRLKKEILAGSSYANAYISVTVSSRGAAMPMHTYPSRFRSMTRQ